MDKNPQVMGLSMLSYIIKPVQRLCKYPLLLRVRTRDLLLVSLPPVNWGAGTEAFVAVHLGLPALP